MQENLNTSQKNRYEIGQTYRVRLSDLVPTQKDDARPSFRDAPIEVFIDKGRLLINNGHHRYYRKLKESDAAVGMPNNNDHYIDIVIVENPYFM